MSMENAEFLRLSGKRQTLGPGKEKEQAKPTET